jgi:hypothetical protein
MQRQFYVAHAVAKSLKSHSPAETTRRKPLCDFSLQAVSDICPPPPAKKIRLDSGQLITFGIGFAKSELGRASPTVGGADQCVKRQSSKAVEQERGHVLLSIAVRIFGNWVRCMNQRR